MKKRRERSSVQRRQLLLRGLVYGTLALLILAAAAYGTPGGKSVLLRSFAYIEGKPTTVRGYGLVVGLPGTGDGSLIRHSDQSLLATIEHLGIDPQGYPIRKGEVAAVFVQADLPAGFDLGMTASVHLTALGDATNLGGGTLLPLTLTSRDGRFSVLAEGPVSAAGNRPLGTAPASAIVERAFTASTSIFMTDVPERNFLLELRGLNAEQVRLVGNLINQRFGVIASVCSDCDIEICLPTAYEASDERAALVLALAAMPIHEALPSLLVGR